jgi:hypothetical protein
MAISSLALGILAIVCFGLFAGIPAIILGHLAYSRARKTPDQYGGSGLAIAGFVMGYASLVTTLIVLVLAARMLPALGQAQAKAQSINCVNNLKQVGLAFRTWAVDNSDRYPFNVSTNQGGTMELSTQGSDGFDPNPARIFQVMSNELFSPKILVCPADSSKQAAIDFQDLSAANVSYQVRSGTNIDETNPSEVLARCPIHGHEVLCDGSVRQGRQR